MPRVTTIKIPFDFSFNSDLYSEISSNFLWYLDLLGSRRVSIKNNFYPIFLNWSPNHGTNLLKMFSTVTLRTVECTSANRLYKHSLKMIFVKGLYRPFFKSLFYFRKIN